MVDTTSTTVSKDSSVIWNRSEEDDFIDYCKFLLNYKALKDLELRARQVWEQCLGGMTC